MYYEYSRINDFWISFFNIFIKSKQTLNESKNLLIIYNIIQATDYYE